MNKLLSKVRLPLLIAIGMSFCWVSSAFTEKHPIKAGNEDKERYLNEIFENISIQKDVVFGEAVNAKGIKESLALDVYMPENDNIKKRPVIVWMHGGGFRYGNDKTQSYIVEMAKRFAKKGYVCISIDYRLREKPLEDIAGTLSDAVEDATKALKWVRKNSKSLNIDRSKIIVGGGSAGGILGSNLFFGDKAKKKAKAGVIGFVNLWGTTGEKWGQLNRYKKAPPTIIVHGTSDELVPYSNSVELVKKLTANSVHNELVTFKDAGHTPVKHMDEFEIKIAAFLYGLI
ncbi:alpha/beta hydrolase [Cyclobacterium marinum]|uniref:Carboxylesterase type B n=1 Tax=Cyclobacterium marinum (strain ATCC 25205 / DSM 745 / LMG 13164 / NCIMB 1802) TaxID=880070 RepID=G0J2N9_CYCMS|nr:alpha/beta hydrolase [Cyclobacterium marinum]AEL26622.1 Carboxylesterase type B [Cyclobacterium marinum DSM 745]MBR9774850.1 alpha/beta hydrolase [Cytophagales bacterium]|tara:strand:+ start:7795 stop:8655 length:861 start_codon:yes stop_codon:yes gene_type:complete